MEPPQPNHQPPSWLMPGAITVSLLLTLFAVFQLPRAMDRSDVAIDLGTSASIVLVVVLLAVGVANILSVRFLVLPKMAETSREAPEAAPFVAYGFAIAPAVYGVVVTVFTGQGLLALPFGAMTLAGIAVMHQYFR